METWDTVYEKIQKRYEPEQLLRIFKDLLENQRHRIYLVHLMEEFIAVWDDPDMKKIYEHLIHCSQSDSLFSYRRIYIHDKIWNLVQKGKEDRKARDTMILMVRKCLGI